MLDWLKTILGDAYTEEIDKKVSEEIGKGFVARADFNALNAEKKGLTETVKARDEQLKTLQASTGDAEALKAQIKQLQEDNKTAAETHAAEIKKIRVDSAVEAALVGAKAKNVKAVKALLDLSNPELAEDGTVKGLAEQIQKLTAAAETGFLFDTESGKPAFKGLKPGEGSNDPAPGTKQPKDMSYDELCDYLAKNPDAKL